MLPAMAVAAALSAAGGPGLRSLLTPPPGVKVAVSVKVSKLWRNLQDMLLMLRPGCCMMGSMAMHVKLSKVWRYPQAMLRILTSRAA